jgi:hypothetical protein
VSGRCQLGKPKGQEIRESQDQRCRNMDLWSPNSGITRLCNTVHHFSIIEDFATWHVNDFPSATVGTRDKDRNVGQIVNMDRCP